MIKTIIKAISSAFIFIVLLSIVLAGWAGFAFVSQPSKSSEIINLIQDIYTSQKSVIVDVIDLSKVLIKDTSESGAFENNDILVENELSTDLEDKSQLDELSINEDNGDNPLGIVIEPSLPKIGENNLPEIIEEPLVDEQSEVSMNEMEIGMDMS